MSFYEGDPDQIVPKVVPSTGSNYVNSKRKEVTLKESVIHSDERPVPPTLPEMEIPDSLMLSPAAIARKQESEEARTASGLSHSGKSEFSDVSLKV
jgi:hypothetical protein